MDDKLFILVLAGTTRVQRQSIKAAKFVAEIGNTYEELEVQLVDPGDFNFPGDGNDPEGKDARYSELTARADGFFIVTPEYNHSFPGSLKRMLDSELETYIHKPVALAGASSGAWGGVRAVEALVMSVREMGLVATFTSAYFPHVQDAFDDSGKPVDKKTEASVRRAYDELIWMGKVLKAGRDNVG
ncbi:NAD(P)H-dependent oxidoreductase [soil metagenome]